MHNWDDWRVFLAVIDAGSFTGAAKQLGLNQPTVGRRIELLEQRLGVKLFQRHARGLNRTDLADRLAAQARMMADGAEALSRLAGSREAQTSGVVKLTAAPAMAGSWLAERLVEFRRQQPDIEVWLMSTSGMADLGAGEADIALRFLRPVEGDLVTRRLGGIYNRLYAHESYLAEFGEPRSADELAGHRLVGYYDEFSAQEAEWFKRILPSGTRFAMQTNHALSCREYVEHGGGIGFLPDFITIGRPGLRPVLPTLSARVREIWLAIHRDLARIARIRLLADYLVAAFEADAVWRGEL